MKLGLFLTVFRFKEHIQNNLPRDFLTTEQFVQLRRELASVNGHSGEDAQPDDDLPSGAEDITDPAKVWVQGVFISVLLLTLCLKDKFICREFSISVAEVFS